ncbi:MBOAT family O-acyltransferase [Hallerella porci]|uniref:Alginate O-acetyltransferase complex protein AlgI n=2 Tax=Hallerella porci TaxID=1945871 RepID=A0ABX5LPL6_9BACT|nr:MBOAT family O-acyltransferase [Hallerella porci]PWL04081.1 alginate O-acetyltransferase complex protein AlgI [Hallerella porci]
MVFSSQIFLFYFLPLFFAGYYFLLWRKAKHSSLNFFITIFSYIFYGWMEPWLVFLMFGTTLVNYFAGRFISKENATRTQRNLALAISVIVNLGTLGFFKYYMFAMGGVNAIAEAFGAEPFTVLRVLLPVGISFYTFQAMSYTIDVWRGDAPPVKNFATFACYVSLFPQLVAGPIVRYNTVAEELATRKHTFENWMRGMTYFCLGFAKKILIANQVGVIADRVFEADAPGILNAWWGSIAYMMQIYFDFSAYSDMAVGLGLMLGFHFPRNFNGPYRSGSISEFWSRWHISLTTWLKDYLYIPLGGNRVSRGRTYLNLFLVMFASGVWHGAAMTFICWGLFHAFFMIVERINGKRALYYKLPRIAQIGITQIIVLFGWVLFRATDLTSAGKMWGAMLGLTAVNPADPILSAEIFTPTAIVFMLLAFIYAFSPLRAFDWCQKISIPRTITAFALFAFAVLALFTQTYNPFLYFQF